MRKILVYTLLLVLPVLNSCLESRAKSRAGIISEKKMVSLLVETHLASALLFVDRSTPDEKRDKGLYYYPSVFEKNGVTKAQMDSSVAWYMKHPAAYERIYDQVMKELEKMKAAEKETEIPE